MAGTLDIRFWINAKANSQITVTYRPTPTRSIVVSTTALDPAYPVTDSSSIPRDGILAGAVLATFCEGTDQVQLIASNLRPFATINVTPNSPACDLSTLAIVRATGFAPVSPATTGSGQVVGTGGTAPYNVTIGTTVVTADAMGLATFNGLAPGAYVATLTDSAASPSTRTASFVVPALVIAGCNIPTALNYNPAATGNDGSCVFVAVDAQPVNLIAAHLPVPVLMRAAPISQQPGVMFLFIESAATLAGPWSAVGQLRQTADPVTAVAAFNISEICKAQFPRILAPLESGTDSSLSSLLRLRYVVQSSVGQDTYAGTLAPFRALNAAVAPPIDGVLTVAAPFTAAPITAALWINVASLANGVSAHAIPLPAAGCPARQFVWLNLLGGWQSGFFTGRHVHGTDQADPVAFRDQYGADRYASRGAVRPTLQVFSDKLDYDTYYAIRGIRDSIQVYERTAAGQYVPVLVGSGGYTEYQEQTDKTWEVNFTVSYPPVLIQTQ